MVHWWYYIGVLAAMSVAFVVGFKLKFHAGLVMILASLVGFFAVGNFFPVRHMVEGGFFFFYLMMVIASSVVFVTMLEASGGFEAITDAMVLGFHKYPSVLLCFLMLFVMLPAMLTGSAPVAVLSTGVLAVPILQRIGLPKVQTAAFLAMGGMIGQPAPPINVMVMIICTSVFMPYEGFDLPLAVMTFPMAVFSAIFVGRKWVKKDMLDSYVAEIRAKKGIRRPVPAGAVGFVANASSGGFDAVKPYLPLIVLSILFIGPRVWPTKFVDPGAPFTFIVSAIVALIFATKKVDVIAVSKLAMKKSLGVLTLFVGIGTLVQSISYNGLRGFIAVAAMAVPRQFLYPFIGITAPLVCGPLVPFGASAVVGPPFVLSFTDQNSVIITSAVTVFLSLGCLVPPTALSGLFGARAVGIENQYGKVLKVCLIPSALIFIEALLFMIYANPIGKFFGV